MISLLALISLSALPLKSPGDSPSVALVFRLAGEARVTPAAGGDARAARQFDWLESGDELRVEKETHVEIVFVTGARYEFTGPAAAVLTEEGLGRNEGKIEAREPLPPLPRRTLNPHEADAFASTRLGGVVLRGSSLRWIYPRQGATTLADQTTLRFGTSEETSAGCRVILEDEDGTVLLHKVVKDDEVAIPPDLLVEGRRYYWRVLALDSAGTTGTAEGEFTTLDSVRSSQRRILQEQLDATSDPYVIALAGEVDRSLGLLWESRKSSCRARDLLPEDAPLRERCAELESLLQR